MLSSGKMEVSQIQSLYTMTSCSVKDTEKRQIQKSVMCYNKHGQDGKGRQKPA